MTMKPLLAAESKTLFRRKDFRINADFEVDKSI